MKKRAEIFIGCMFFLSCINFFYILWFYGAHNFLPAPFLYDKANTFMDFYNTLYWSMHDGVYVVWKSVYPPLSFLLLDGYHHIFLADISTLSDGFAIREEVGHLIIPWLLICVSILFFAVRICFHEIAGNKLQFMIFMIFLLSPPFLFALERGNLIVLNIWMLSWYIFSKNTIHRSVALAILVNLKPYFIILYILQLLSKNAREENKNFLFITPVLILLIFLLSGLLLNQEFYLLPNNLFGFAAERKIFSPTEVLSFPSTVIAFEYFGDLAVKYRSSEIFFSIFRAVLYFYIIKSIMLASKKTVKFEDLAILSVIIITNYSISTGGYGLIYYIPILVILYQQRFYSLIVIIVTTIYLGVWDIIPIYSYGGDYMQVYLSGEQVRIESYLGLGSIIRPLVNFAILILFYNNLKKKYLNAQIKDKY